MKSSHNFLLDEIEEAVPDLLHSIIDIFVSKDPKAAMDILVQLTKLPHLMRDGILMDCLESFLLHVNEDGLLGEKIKQRPLRSLAIILADASPNKEADYTGKPEVLQEYAKRIIKVIDDCGTRQKAVYIANLTRAVIHNEIDTRRFFQLCRCVTTLTDEDLAYLKKHIDSAVISEDEEYIDDYRALALLKETEGGFSYTPRAFELLKYALAYEEDVQIPDSFPERLTPHSQSDLGEISEQEIKDLLGISVEDETMKLEWKDNRSN